MLLHLVLPLLGLSFPSCCSSQLTTLPNKLRRPLFEKGSTDPPPVAWTACVHETIYFSLSTLWSVFIISIYMSASFLDSELLKARAIFISVSSYLSRVYHRVSINVCGGRQGENEKQSFYNFIFQILSRSYTCRYYHFKFLNIFILEKMSLLYRSHNIHTSPDSYFKQTYSFNKLLYVESSFITGTVFLMRLIVNLTKEVSMDPGPKSVCRCLRLWGASGQGRWTAPSIGFPPVRSLLLFYYKLI